MKLRGKVSIYAEQEIPDDVWNSSLNMDVESGYVYGHVY